MGGDFRTKTADAPAPQLDPAHPATSSNTVKVVLKIFAPEHSGALE